MLIFKVKSGLRLLPFVPEKLEKDWLLSLDFEPELVIGVAGSRGKSVVL